MAQVTIDSGPLDATYRLRDVPQQDWRSLMQLRRDYLGVRLPYDCRCLLEYVNDAEQMFKPLGFSSVEDFIRHGLDLDPQQVTWAIEGLRRMKPDEEIPFTHAVAVGRSAQELAADPTVLAAAPNRTAGPGRGHKTVAIRHGLSTLSSESAERIVRRLKRDHPKIAEALARGEYSSARAAGIKAGIVKVKTPLEQLQHWWKKANKTDRVAFQFWVNKRNKRARHER